MITKEQLRELGWSDELADRVLEAVAASAGELVEVQGAVQLTEVVSETVMSNHFNLLDTVATDSRLCFNRT